MSDMSAMSLSQPPVSPEQIAPLPPEFRALLEAVIGHFEQRIAGLVAELATVKAELATTTAELAKAKAELAAAKRTPRNSSVPPSTKHPHAKPKWQRPRSRKKRGGQPGHQKYARPLIPCQRAPQKRPPRTVSRSRRSNRPTAGGAANRSPAVTWLPCGTRSGRFPRSNHWSRSLSCTG